MNPILFFALMFVVMIIVAIAYFWIGQVRNVMEADFFVIPNVFASPQAFPMDAPNQTN